MKKIYLASNSRARKKLFETFGLKFQVFPSRIKEERHRGKLSFAALAKSNALKKAQDVAGKVKAGVVIAADTFTVQDGRIFGKPADLKEARRMLKILSRCPQLVYSGIAVIDKDKNRTLVDFEKTKVYMDRLTDSQLRRYFSRVCPLDKAGSFDIQGKGAFFIRRIEGCFYNVVGLPVAKLYRMLRKLKIDLLALVFIPVSLALFLSGCTTEYNIATGKEESYMYSTDKEVQIGQSIVRQAEKEYTLVDDPLVQKRVQDIGKKIAAVCDRKDIDYTFKVLDEEEINAVSLPGGFVYINEGLVEAVDNDDELAAVIAHEVAHIVARHSIKKLQALHGYTLLRVLIAAAPQPGQVGTAADAAFAELYVGYSREDELLADKLGARYARLAGYDPNGMIDFLHKLAEDSRNKPSQPISYYKTHPYVPDRIREVKRELGEDITFEDYINIEQRGHGE